MEGGVAETSPEQPKADLQRQKRLFEEWRSLTATARAEAVVDIDYYDAKQLTEGEKQILAKRNQPDIVINRIRPAVNGILGVVDRGKSEPRAFPRTPKDGDSADVATDTLRFIADYNRLDQTKIHCFKDMLVPGSTAVQVTANADLQVTIEQIRWEEFCYDPRSRREDFSDARWLGIARWMYADDLAALYRDKADDIEAAVNSGSMGVVDQSLQDRPNDSPQTWVDRKQRRLLVVEQYYREADGWYRCVFISSELLWEGPSPYLDDKKRPACPIVAVSAYVDRENNRYGAVRDMRGPQDEINKRRSKILHYLNTRQIQEVEYGSGAGNADEARAEAARPDGVIPSGWAIVPHQDQVTGQFELLQEAKSEIERLGPNPAILGREGTDSSGRALLARQQSGLVELAILFGLLEDWELRVYRQCWARAKQFWTQPQWVRVTDDEGAPQFVGLNQPQMGVDPYTGQQVVLGYQNQVAELDVDIILDATPDTANVQQEQFQDLMQLVGSNPAYAQSVPFEMLLELSAVPHKRQLIDQLKQFREQAQQGQAQQQQIGRAGAVAKIRETNATAALKEAQAANEQMKPQMDALQMGIQAQPQMGPPPGP